MIGSRLRFLRKKSRLTQEQLGGILRINKHSISTYEREKNQPSNDMLVRIAKYFDVSADYLLGITNNPAPHGTTGSRYLRLPEDFTEKEREKLIDYMGYLIYQRSKSHRADEK